MFVGLFTLFSPLYCIWKIYTITKTKLYSFRGRILAQVLNCSLCLCNSGRITAAHLSFFPSFFILPKFLLFHQKLFTEPHFAPGTILVRPALWDTDTLTVLTLQMRKPKLGEVKFLAHKPKSACHQNLSSYVFCAASQEWSFHFIVSKFHLWIHCTQWVNKDKSSGVAYIHYLFVRKI